MGLNFGLPFFVICFSGTFATLSNALDWLRNDDLRVEGKESPIAWGAIHKNLLEEYPKGQILNLMEQKNSFTGPQCDYPCHFQEGTVVKGRFTSNGMPNYISLSLRATNYRGDTLKAVFKGASALPKLTLDKKWTSFDPVNIALQIEDYQGNTWNDPLDLQRIIAVRNEMMAGFPETPEREYPSVPYGVYAIAGIFGLLTSVIIGI
ncbi:MAG: hypothetical protein AAGH81_17420 [Bacteroidota bacterium]